MKLAEVGWGQAPESQSKLVGDGPKHIGQCLTRLGNVDRFFGARTAYNQRQKIQIYMLKSKFHEHASTFTACLLMPN